MYMQNHFKKTSAFQLIKLQLNELEHYYVELRRYEFQQKIPIRYAYFKKLIHPLLLLLIKVERNVSKEKLYVIGDKSVKTKTPKIYACTHIGGNDVQRTFEAIRDHAYLFLGDPRELYRDFNGKLLRLNGAICLETNNKEDRYIAYLRAVELLNKGVNLLIYPEGAWNITDNLPVMRLYSGTVKMAIETGADIIPVAIEQYGQKFIVNIGENLTSGVFKGKSISDCNKILRVTLATLKWNIWENNGRQSRDSIPQSFIDNYKQQIVDKCPYGFTIQDVYDSMCKY